MREIIMRCGWHERRFFESEPLDWREESPFGATPVGVHMPQAQLFDSFSEVVRVVGMLKAFGWRVHRRFGE